MQIRMIKGPETGKVFDKDEKTATLAVNAKVAEFVVKEQKETGETKELKTVKNTKRGGKGRN
jgi:hypothetical protein